MVLLTFNFKGIDELTGNPPILLDVQEEKVFKDVLLDVIDKLNPLLPVGKKLTLESLGIESFDGEPLSWVSYAKLVADVIIDFGTSFVVVPKREKPDKVAANDIQFAEKQLVDGGSMEVFDITADVLKTEGMVSKREAIEELSLRRSVAPVVDDDRGAVGGGKAPAIVSGKPSTPSLPVISASRSTPPKSSPAPGPAPSPPGGAAGEAKFGLARPADMPSQAQQGPAPPSASLESVALPVPPRSIEGEKEKPKATERDKADRREKKKASGKDTSMKNGLAKTEGDDEEQGEEFDELIEDTTTKPAKTQYDKSISVDYFDVMNPENYYPVVVDIADIEQAWKPVEENIVTGERKVQVKEKAVFETDTVLVRPVFPGCTVAPPELEADLTKPKELLTFYVTPLVRGGIRGELHFMSKGKLVHVTQTPAEVKDPRFARYIMFYGLLVSIVPKISQMLNIPLEQVLNDLVGTTLLLGMSLSTFIAAAGTGIAVIIGLIYFVSHKPKNARMQLHLTDFRMTLIPPTIL